MKTSIHDGEAQWWYEVLCHPIIHQLNRFVSVLKALRSVMWVARLGWLEHGRPSIMEMVGTCLLHAINCSPVNRGEGDPVG